MHPIYGLAFSESQSLGACLQVQGQALVPAAAFNEMAIGAAHKLLNTATLSNNALPVLVNAALPAPLALAVRDITMDCVLLESSAGAELMIQSSGTYFRASIVRVSQQHKLSETGNNLCQAKDISN